MSHHTYGVKTVCPFYEQEAEKSITCEGLIAGTRSMTRFAGREQKTQFQKQVCAKGCYAAYCPLAQALYRKYG